MWLSPNACPVIDNSRPFSQHPRSVRQVICFEWIDEIGKKDEGIDIDNLTHDQSDHLQKFIGQSIFFFWPCYSFKLDARYFLFSLVFPAFGALLETVNYSRGFRVLAEIARPTPGDLDNNKGQT